LPLPGGDAAIQHPERTAYGYLRTLLPGLAIGHLLPDLSAAEKRVIDAMLVQQINTPQTSSMGRLFDAVSALLGLCRHATHEAEAAIALEGVALQSHDDSAGFPYVIEGDSVRLTPLLAAMTTALAAATPIPDIARRFHRTVAELSVAMARAAMQATPEGPTTVALSGGVWQNRLLLEMTVPLLRDAGFAVLLHHQVPANDGGIAYGQAAVAAARLAHAP
jgi:hydrogenase maturation protein HypF